MQTRLRTQAVGQAMQSALQGSATAASMDGSVPSPHVVGCGGVKVVHRRIVGPVVGETDGRVVDVGDVSTA